MGPLSRPTLPLLWLDTLWIQVSGTLCNIACTHCFVRAGPNVQTHRLMTAAQVTRALDDGVAAGMRSVWYTGGEPFHHPGILALVDLALARAPLGILTNGLLIDDALAGELSVSPEHAEPPTVSCSPDSRAAAFKIDGLTITAIVTPQPFEAPAGVRTEKAKTAQSKDLYVLMQGDGELKAKARPIADALAPRF